MEDTKLKMSRFFPVIRRIDKAKVIVDGKDREFVVNDRYQLFQTAYTTAEGSFLLRSSISS